MKTTPGVPAAGARPARIEHIWAVTTAHFALMCITTFEACKRDTTVKVASMSVLRAAT